MRKPAAEVTALALRIPMATCSYRARWGRHALLRFGPVTSTDGRQKTFAISAAQVLLLTGGLPDRRTNVCLPIAGEERPPAANDGTSEERKQQRSGDETRRLPGDERPGPGEQAGGDRRREGHVLPLG